MLCLWNLKWYGIVESKSWPRPGALPVKPQVVWQGGIKILAMLGVSPVNPQVVWRDGIKILAMSKCSACETSSGMVEWNQNPGRVQVLRTWNLKGYGGGASVHGRARLFTCERPKLKGQIDVKALTVMAALKHPDYEPPMMRHNNTDSYMLPKYQPKRGGDLGWGKLFRFKCGIKNYFQLAKTNLRTQFNCNKI